MKGQWSEGIGWVSKVSKADLEQALGLNKHTCCGAHKYVVSFWKTPPEPASLGVLVVRFSISPEPRSSWERPVMLRVFGMPACCTPVSVLIFLSKSYKKWMVMRVRTARVKCIRKVLCFADMLIAYMTLQIISNYRFAVAQVCINIFQLLGSCGCDFHDCDLNVSTPARVVICSLHTPHWVPNSEWNMPKSQKKKRKKHHKNIQKIIKLKKIRINTPPKKSQRSCEETRGQPHFIAQAPPPHAAVRRRDLDLRRAWAEVRRWWWWWWWWWLWWWWWWWWWW